ncbi:hypothetical protein ACFV6G_27795, partial [Streptomyces lavendulae]
MERLTDPATDPALLRRVLGTFASGITVVAAVGAVGPPARTGRPAPPPPPPGPPPRGGGRVRWGTTE